MQPEVTISKVELLRSVGFCQSLVVTPQKESVRFIVICGNPTHMPQV